MSRADDLPVASRIHLLDVGQEEYGDSILCQFADTSVLIDGAHPGNQVGTELHPSIPDQLRVLLEQSQPPYHVNLLIVSHAHLDHIGCLPFLIDNDLLVADWALVADPALGWGRAQDAVRAPAPRDTRAMSLVAALREEPRSSATDDRVLSRLLADAVTLETRYLGMLDQLTNRGTRVVRFGTDEQQVRDVVDAFANIGLRILGPSVNQLAICADAIANATDAAMDDLSDLLTRDVGSTEVALYRQLVGGLTDALDASSRPGPAINLQSLVTCFEVENVKCLFAGDMQFADPERTEEGLETELQALRDRVAEQAPYDFVKISHHGSSNAFSAEILQELGETRLFGICAGEESLAHPSPPVLDLLRTRSRDVRWARTDRNGRSTFSFGRTRTRVLVSRGEVNDARPNTADEPIVSSSIARSSAEPTPTGAEMVGATRYSGGEVTLDLRLPSAPSRLTISLQLGEQPAHKRIGASDVATAEIRIGGGRPLPSLLFVTNQDALSRNIGQIETDRTLEAIRASGQELVEALPGTNAVLGAARPVQERLREDAGLRGVVLIGGYDVVPSLRLDVLPPRLRARLGASQDPDRFVVWSDDVYGDIVDDDSQPERPVSRIPDGRSADLVFAAIQAGAPRAGSRKGVRNVARPFAGPIYDALPGPLPVAVSEPHTFDRRPRLALDADCIYLMLHGDFADSSRFWGEDTPGNVEAVNLTNVPNPSGGVVFTGCCWGALTADQPAERMLPETAPSQKAPASSIAMTFLLNGANAFVGCTGAHYSPTVEPYAYFGGPMHSAFWQQYLSGVAPAASLLAAKRAYLTDMPHGQSTDLRQAIEFKTLHQYTCLGLGW